MLNIPYLKIPITATHIDFDILNYVFSDLTESTIIKRLIGCTLKQTALLHILCNGCFHRFQNWIQNVKRLHLIFNVKNESSIHFNAFPKLFSS